MPRVAVVSSMALRIRTVIRGLLGWGDGDTSDDDASDEADGGGFVPSPLDRSVRFAHGSSDDDVGRALSEIDDRARELEDQRSGK